MESRSLTYDFGLRNRSVTEAGDKLTISGVASNWDLDRVDDAMLRTAFDRSLRRYLTTNPILLYMHRPSMPMGRVLEAFVRDDGLHVKAELPKPEPGTEAANVWRLVKGGIIRAFSVGGKAKRRVIGGITTIVDWDLSEISIAPIGVNPTTLFTLSEQMGKAFGDPVDPASELRVLRHRIGALTGEHVDHLERELITARLKLLKIEAMQALQ